MRPTYSICMCNYNMEDTLERSLGSLLEQLDELFEVVVVDDGSSDRSVEVVKSLQQRYEGLRLVALKRDKKRKLGLTRNISVQEAKGDYVLLHLDCDDVFGPFLKDFTQVFHKIEGCIGRDILLSGRHVNMGRRQFLLKHGPYRNLYRGEDRDLWVRLAAEESFIPFDHVNFITRLPKTKKVRIRKAVIDTWDHLVNDFRSGMTFRDYLKERKKRRWKFNWKVSLFRLVALVPAYIKSKFEEPLPPLEEPVTPAALVAYRERIGGSYVEIVSRHGCDADLSFLRPEAREIFLGKDH